MKNNSLWSWRKNIWEVIVSHLSKKPTDTSVIPKDIPYCYAPKEAPCEENGWKYKITPCPYYVSLPNNYNHCKFLKHTTDDDFFGDHCKICGENFDDE